MSGFPQCTRLQQGYQCSCPACLDTMLVNNMELNQSHQQLHANHAGPVGYRGYTGNVPTQLLNTDDARPADNFGIPVTQANNQLQNDHTQNDGNRQGFSAINIGHREGSYNSSGDGFSEIQQPHTPDEMPQQHQQSDAMPPVLTSALDQQAKARPKRKSKYNDEPPQSVYGPPFVTREISARMSEDEIRRRVDYNAKVADARKLFLRHKNNMAAKKSRERKQALIDQLTAETQRLSQRLQQVDAANRELVDSAAHVHAVDNENNRLRQENNALRAHMSELTRKLAELNAEHQRGTGQLGAAFSPQPAPNTSEQMSPAAQVATAQNPEQHRERNEEDQPNRGGAAEMNIEIDQFLSDLDNGGNGGAFSWDNYRSLVASE